ncbi:MAG TPA: YfhO family protein [Longilinea sp.]|nr:YfhO family protein [Longilinea sp.]
MQFIPWRFLAWEQITSGIWPFWNPLNGMGAPLLANYQLALYYPPGWLLYILQTIGGAPWMAWGFTLLLAAHLSWAGYGTAKLVKQFGLNELAQVVAGLAFSMSGFLVARAGFISIIWSAAWLPWLVLCVESFSRETVQSRKLGLMGWLALCSGMQLLSGHAQITWYSFILLGFWALVAGWNRRGWRSAVTTIVVSIAGILLGACLAAVQLIPTFELLQQSQRASSVNFELAMVYSFWPWRILTLIAPNFFGNPAFGDYWGYASFWEDAIYIGLLPSIMAFSTLEFLKRRNLEISIGEQQNQNRIYLLWGLSIIGTLFALGKNTPIFPFFYRSIPTFDMFQAPARYMLWLVFSLSLLSGFGIQSLARPVGKAIPRFRKAIFALFTGIAATAAAYFILPGVEPSFVYSLIIAAVFSILILMLLLNKPADSTTKNQDRWNWLVAMLVGSDLLWAGWGQNPSAPMQFYKVNINNVGQTQDASQGRIYIDARSEYILKFSRFLRFKDYREKESWDELRLAQLPNINILTGLSSANNFEPLQPARYYNWMQYLTTLPQEKRTPWLRMMDVNQVEVVTDAFETTYRYQTLIGGERFAFYPCSQFALDSNDAWNKTKNAINNGLSLAVIEKGEVLEGNCDLQSVNKISILSENATRLVMDINVSQNGWFMVTDTWYPGWMVAIDGSAAQEISRVNYLFRGFPLQAGQHSIVIEYRPWWISLSIMISIAGIFSIVLLLILGRKSISR